jgi:phage terminase large subunit
MTNDTPELHLEAHRHFRCDPVGFGEHVLGVTPWSKYRSFLQSVRDFDRVAVRAGQKVSKTKGLAVLSLWWVCTRTNGKVIFCLPSDLQGQTGVYAEILGMREDARYNLGGDPHLDTGSGIVWSPQRRIFGFSADGSAKQTEKFLGHSGADLLFILDEAPGIPDSIIRALDGNRAGGGKIVMAGNPTRTHGKFYDAFHSEARSWKGVHISSLDSPNVTGEVHIPGLALPSYIAEKRVDWGEKSWDYQVKILGQFCEQDEHAFISLQAVDEAQKRWSELPNGIDLAQPLRIGVDPARLGKDESVIAIRRGNWIGRLQVLKQKDNGEVAAAVMAIVREHARPGEYVRVKVDQTNNNGVADIIRARRASAYGSPRSASSRSTRKRARATRNFATAARRCGLAPEWLARAPSPTSASSTSPADQRWPTDTTLAFAVQLEDKRSTRRAPRSLTGPR